MVFRQISTDIKECALALMHQGWDLDTIIEALDVSSRSIQRWTDIYNKYETVIQPQQHQQGRPRILDNDSIHDLLTLIKEQPQMYLNEIAEWLAIHHDMPISRSTLCSNLRDIGLKYKIMWRAAAERDEDARASFHAEIANNYSPEQLVFVDESSKDDWTVHRHYSRALSGQHTTIREPFGHGCRYSILPALSLNRYLAIRIVSGSVNGGELLDFVIYKLVQLSPALYRYPL
jgi:transposase